ncbi:MAG TPA: LppP/LprE family lipoprotein [Solirubrobacteraceae bacterium]
MKLIGAIGALAVGMATAGGVAACGSSNASSPSLPTVTITTPAPTPTEQPSTPATTPATTTTLPTVINPPAQTRTATGPAFTQTTGGASSEDGALGAAVATLKSRGYTPVSTSTYDPNQTLRVLIGSSGGAEQAFFFDGTKYLGTDTKDPSRSISVTGQADTEVTLRYGTTNGSATVHFELDMGQLAPLETIPTTASRG